MGNAIYIAKTLDTDPPIVERVRVLEFQTSEIGKTMTEIKNLLLRLDTTIESVNIEQSRRKPLVDYVEKQMNWRK